MTQPRPPLALSGQVNWNFCFREACEKWPSLTCEHFIEVAPHARRALGAHWGHFPFPREKGSEKGSGQSVAGVARKPDFLQMSG